MATMSISDDTQASVLSYYGDLLTRRHATIQCPLKAEHVNRLMCSTEEWPHVKWMLDRYPKHFRTTTRVLFLPEALGLEPMEHLPFVDTAHFEGVNVPRLCIWPDEGLKKDVLFPFQPIDRLSRHMTGYVCRDTKLYVVLCKWAASHYRMAWENIQAYELIRVALESMATWLQLKKHWPELMNDVIRAKNADQLARDAARRIPDDIKTRDPKGARRINDDVEGYIRKYRKVVMPTVLHGALIRDQIKSTTPLKNRAVYALYACNYYPMDRPVAHFNRQMSIGEW